MNLRILGDQGRICGLAIYEPYKFLDSESLFGIAAIYEDFGPRSICQHSSPRHRFDSAFGSGVIQKCWLFQYRHNPPLWRHPLQHRCPQAFFSWQRPFTRCTAGPSKHIAVRDVKRVLAGFVLTRITEVGSKALRGAVTHQHRRCPYAV